MKRTKWMVVLSIVGVLALSGTAFALTSGSIAGKSVAITTPGSNGNGGSYGMMGGYGANGNSGGYGMMGGISANGNSGGYGMMGGGY